jgi:hypothetical protein
VAAPVYADAARAGVPDGAVLRAVVFRAVVFRAAAARSASAAVAIIAPRRTTSFIRNPLGGCRRRRREAAQWAGCRGRLESRAYFSGERNPTLEAGRLESWRVAA